MSERVDVSIEPNAHLRRYEAWVDGALAGFSEYRMRGTDTFVFTHTQVDESFEGHGVASRLIRGALDDVRRKGGSVVARCPFVATFVRDHPEYEDLLVDSS